MRQEYISISPTQTEIVGQKIAKEILKSPPPKRAVIIGLMGDLGGGKTTFLKGFARGLGIKQKILSPTFVIMRRFKIQDSRFKNFYHIDCYRIENPKEILALGFKEIISDPKNIICVEWADRIKKILPKNSIILKFKFVDKNKRRIKKAEKAASN